MVAQKRTRIPKHDPTAEYGCTIKQLPKEEQVGAADFARSIMPANEPAQKALALATAMSTDDAVVKQHIALMTSKYFGPKPRDLSVSFLETTDAATADMILSHLNAWADHPRFPIGIKFRRTNQTGEIRISRGTGGYWSYLGTDCLRIPVNQQTMNLQGITSKFPLSEQKRVIRHEAGHTLGFPHEHMRKEIVAMLDADKVVREFMATQGWSRQEVYQQILTPLDDRSILGTPVDIDSLMAYRFNGNLTKTGKPIPGGVDINDTDAQFAQKQYPSATVVEPPPDEQATIEQGDAVLTCSCGIKHHITIALGK